MNIEKEYKILDTAWIIEGKEKSKHTDLKVVKGVVIEIKNIDNNKSVELITEESLKRSSFARSRKMFSEDLYKNDISTAFFSEKEALETLIIHEEDTIDNRNKYSIDKIAKLKQRITDKINDDKI